MVKSKSKRKSQSRVKSSYNSISQHEQTSDFQDSSDSNDRDPISTISQEMINDEESDEIIKETKFQQNTLTTDMRDAESQLDFDSDSINQMSQEQLRVFVKENNLEKEIPKYNNISNEKLKIQINRVMKKRENPSDVHVTGYTEENPSKSDNTANKQSFLPEKDGFTIYSAESGKSYGFFVEDGEVSLIGIRNSDDIPISDQFSNKEAKEIAVEELNLQSDDFKIDFDYD